jgi:glycerate 2-kinase
MRVLCAPDKFKHACSAEQAARAMAEGARLAAPGAQIETLPLADGGEGTLEALKRHFPRLVPVVAHDALRRPVATVIALNEGGTRALVESAQACGLWRLTRRERNPLLTDSFGVGEMIAAALDAGAREIMLGLGGSATSDGGAGMLAALGARLLDARGSDAPPAGGKIGSVHALDTSSLRHAPVTALCDILLPMLGPEAAGPQFLAQKGADHAAARTLQANLAHWAQVAGADGRAPGSGAAGGLGYGVLLLGGRLTSGAETVLELTGFERRLSGVDLVLTGEGSYDAQTAKGKLIHAMAAICAKAGVPLIVLAGRARAKPLPGVSAIYAMEAAGKSRLKDTAENLTRLARQAVSDAMKQHPQISN